MSLYATKHHNCPTCRCTEPVESSDSDALAGYVRHIPQAVYPCRHCWEVCSWLATDLWWSEIDKDWVCDQCWTDRDSEEACREERGISLADEIKRRT